MTNESQWGGVQSLLIAVEQGDADAQYVLGAMFAFGQGAPQDDAQAVKWYRKAAEQGHALAQFNLGYRYLKGEGVAQDLVFAYALFILVAAGGNEDAMKGKIILVDVLPNANKEEGERIAGQWQVGTPLPDKSSSAQVLDSDK